MPGTPTHLEHPPANRPGGISLAAAILSLLICCGAICLLGSVAALFFIRYPLVPRTPSVRIILGSFDLLLLLFLIWCACTVAGLFRLRSWARYSIIVIGVLDFVVFALLCALMLMSRRQPLIIGMDAQPNPAMPLPLGTMILALGVMYGGIALIGIWWVIYFNLPTVRLAFSRGSGDSPLPGV